MGRVIDPEQPLDFLYWGWCLLDIDPALKKGEEPGSVKVVKRSLRAARVVVKTLLSFSLKVGRDFLVSYTGNNGFHILIHPYVFSQQEPTHNLPEIYKDWVLIRVVNSSRNTEQEKLLLQDSVDIQVYKRKKGVCTWSFSATRTVQSDASQPAVARQVLTISTERVLSAFLSETATASTLTKASQLPLSSTQEKKQLAIYRLVTPLNPFDVRPRKEWNKGLQVLAKKHQRLEYLTSDAAISVKGKLDCVERIIYGKASSGSNFNKAAMQVAVFVNNNPEHEDRVKKTLSKNWRGKRYRTMAATLAAFEEKMAHVADYDHSCPALVAVCTDLKQGHPACDQCPVQLRKEGKFSQEDYTSIQREEHELAYEGSVKQGVFGDIIVQDGRTFDRNGNQIASFTARYVNENRNELNQVEETVLEFVPSDADLLSVTCGVPVSTLSSLARFMTFTASLGRGFSFNASSNEILRQWLDSVYDNRDRDPETFTENSDVHLTNKVGMKWIPDFPGQLSPGMMVYVERDFSITSTGLDDRYKLRPDCFCEKLSNYRSIVAPELALSDDRFTSLKISEEESLAFQDLLHINEPYVIFSQLIWFIATHLKAHFTANQIKFPILGVSGVPGAGKTETFRILQCLVGVDPMMHDLSRDAPSSSAPYIRELLSSSQSVPIILNEVQSVSRVGRVDPITDMMKAAYDGTSIGRTKLGNKITSQAVEVVTTAPIATLSQKSSDDSAIAQRSIAVNMSIAAVDGASATDYCARFTKTKYEHTKPLVSLAGKMMMEALQTTPAEVSQLFYDVSQTFLVDVSIDNRIRDSFRVLKVAHVWVSDVFKRYGMSDSALDSLHALGEEWQRVIYEEGDKLDVMRSVPEIDRMLMTLAVMCRTTQDSEGLTLQESRLVRGLDYGFSEGTLYLDLHRMYPRLLKRHCNRNMGDNDSIHLTTLRQFNQSCLSRGYLLRNNVSCPELPKTILCVALDATLISARVDNFIEHISAQMESWG
jgi:hypothetical protein